MTKQDINNTVSEAIKAYNKSWQNWIKTLVPAILIPIVSAWSTVKVLENRISNIEEKNKELKEELNNKVDFSLYDQMINGQLELQKLYNENTARIESDSKERDEILDSKIEEVKKFLNKVYGDKKIWIRDKTNEMLYSSNNNFKLKLKT